MSKVFEDDFIQVEDEKGRILGRFVCSENGLNWPPPQAVQWGKVLYKRTNFSQITDEQRQTMTHVCRGAVYVAAPEDEQIDHIRSIKTGSCGTNTLTSPILH